MSTIRLPHPGARGRILGPEKLTFRWTAVVWFPWTETTVRGDRDGVSVTAWSEDRCREKATEALGAFYERQGIPDAERRASVREELRASGSAREDLHIQQVRGEMPTTGLKPLHPGFRVLSETEQREAEEAAGMSHRPAAAPQVIGFGPHHKLGDLTESVEKLLADFPDAEVHYSMAMVQDREYHSALMVVR